MEKVKKDLKKLNFDEFLEFNKVDDISMTIYTPPILFPVIDEESKELKKSLLKQNDFTILS